ncbi:MAG: pyridoxal phosphate-dependent aminotransferase [Rhodospirillales bacterium]|nr:pyridoxal phosphate-dependent aminotransferase [Rhodospirillales bacterium]MDE2458555.1 pyridoxal phosphate-dependent aminotransferase [Rhodospirillales bacterium]
MTEFANRIGRTELAATFAMAARARALQAQGMDIISLSLGEPDFPTPGHVVDAAHEAAKRGDTKYPPLNGSEPLRTAVAQKFTREHGIATRPQDVLVTNGGKQGIFNVIMSLVGEADEVIIPAPSWAGYEQTVKFAGGTPVFVPCPQEHGFVLQPEALANAISGRTKLLILNYPSNPSGAVLSRAALTALAEVLRQYPHVWVLSDDIYEHLLFGSARHETLLGVAPDLANRVVTLSGVSKTYAMTGWRIGWCIGPAEMIQAATMVQATATSGVSTIGQAAALAALTGPQDFLAERASAYEQRRDAVVTALNQMPGISCHRPEGAFYVYPNIAGCLGKTTPGGRVIGSDGDFAMALLEEGRVAVVQGAAFAMSPHIRISTATTLPRLIEACQRISSFCNALA